MDVWTCLIVVLGLLGLLYKYLTKNHGFWESRGVKEKKPTLFFGSIKERFWAKKSFHEFYSELYFEGEGEPYTGFYEGLNPVLMVRDPDLLRNIMSKDFDHFVDRGDSSGLSNPHIEKMMIMLQGEEWKQVRSTVAPTFSTGRIRKMLGMIEDCAMGLQNYIESLIKSNGGETTGDIDVKDTMSKFTLDVIASTAFGVSCDSFANKNSEFASQISRFNDISKLTRFIFLATLILNVPTRIRRLLRLSFFNTGVVDFLAQIVKDTTKYRLANKVRRNDFLQLLMDAQKVSSEDGELENNMNGDVITEDVAIAQSVLFLIAGYETSSTLLTMVCFELAQNLKIQEKLRSEIKDKFESIETLSYDDLNSLPYLDMVIAETLRLHPPVARLDRMCTKEARIGNLKIKKKTKICVPVFGLHTDPKYFPNPRLFDPERFSEEEKAKRHSYVYLPFGQGPRNCIGMRFAQMSVKLCLAHIIHKFVINVSSKTQIPFEYDNRSFLLKPKSGVHLQFSPYSF